MRTFLHTGFARALALVIVLAMLSAGCSPGFLAAVPGLPEYQRIAVVPVPGGSYNTVGANLMIERKDLSVDTILGEQVFGAVYNSANGIWHWSHEIRFDGNTFIDPTGAIHDVSVLPSGSAIPGTVWVKLGPNAIKTKGGWTYSFDSLGRVAFAHWSSDPYPRLAYAWQADRVEVRRCPSATTPFTSCPGLWSIHLGPHGPTEVVDLQSAQAGTSRTVSYTFDASGRLQTARTAFEVAQGLPGSLYEYGLLSTLVSAQANSEGERIEYAWDAGRRLTRVTQIGEGNPTHRFTHELTGVTSDPIYTVTHVNPRGGTTRYHLDGLRRLVMQEFLGASESRHFAWKEGWLRPWHVTDVDGTVRRFSEWSDDDPTRVIEPSGNELRISYEPSAVNFENPMARAIREVSDSLGPVATLTYDAQGRPATRRNGEGEQTTTVYQGLTLSSETTAWGATALLTNYGLHGHWVDAQSTAIPDVPIRRKFDVVGNPIVAAAGLQRGGVLERAYDANRWLESIVVAPQDDAGGVGAIDSVGIERRSDGQITAYRRPGSGDHEIDYDPLGRPRSIRERVDGIWQTTSRAYDALGLVTEISRPNGMRDEFDYDAFGRVTARRVFRNSILEGTATFTWKQGRIVRGHDSIRDQDTLLLYDAAGRIELIVYTGLGESLAYEYDLRSRPTGETYTLPGSPAPAVLELRLAWDLADRQIRLSRADGTSEGERLLERSYAGQRLASIEYGNGLLRNLVYDASTLAFVGFQMTNAQQEQVESTVVSREVAAGPTRLVVSSETTSPLAQTREEYWLNRPGSLSQPEQKIGARVFRWRGWQDGVLDAERFFAWDELGNPVADSDGDAFSYNAERNRLLGVSGPAPHTYTYDEAGYPVTRNGVPLAWTASGMLSRVGPAWSPLVEITWDLGHRPVSIAVAGATREFPLFGGLVEYDATSGQLGWLHHDDVSIPFAGSARVYRHEDFRGNTSLVSDEAGEIVAHKRYQPFGVETEILASGYTEAHPTGFTGALELSGTGLVWIGARILESDTGRFLTPDPLRQEIQQYTYALGNPVWFWDPDGREESPTVHSAFTNAVVTTALFVIGIALITPPVTPLAAVLLGVSIGLSGYALAVSWADALSGPSEGRSTSRGSTGSGKNGPMRKELELSAGIAGAQFFYGGLGSGSGGGQSCASGLRSSLTTQNARWQWLLLLLVALLPLLRLRMQMRDA